MQVQAFLLFITLVPLLARARYTPPSNDATETFFLYFRQGTNKIPVSVQMDVSEKFAYVSSLNESSEEEDSISLYDYRTHVIAFKDVKRNICYLEDMKDSSLLYERRLLQSLRNQVLLGNRETLYAEDPSMSRRQIQSLAGKRVARFCASAVTYKVTSQPQAKLDEGQRRSKRSLSSDVPLTQGSGGFKRSYSHHEQHTQSYANFGHETISFDGNGDSLAPNSGHVSESLQDTDGSVQTPSLKPAQVRTSSSHGSSRTIRELPSDWTHGPRLPAYIGAGGSSGQIHSQMHAGGIGNHGFTATGQFQTANSHTRSYGLNGERGGFGGAHSDINGHAASEDPNRFATSPANNFPHGTNGQQQTGTNHYAQRKPVHTDSGASFPYAGSGHPSLSLNGRGNGRPTGSSQSNGRGNEQLSGNNGYPKGLSPFASGYHPRAGNGASVPNTGALQHPGYSGNNRAGGMHPTSLGSIAKPNGEPALSSQSQIELEKGKIQTDSSTQGAYGGGTTQSQVQGSASKDGTFQAQAQSGSQHGRSQSQVQGSETGAQASSGTMLTNFGQSQSQTQMAYGTRTSQASAQTISSHGSISAQSQGGRQGGQASSQAQGNGGTSSAANVGINNGGDHQSNGQGALDAPFTGRASASSRGGINDGSSQTQVKGDHHAGSTYSASAQGSYGLPDTSNMWPSATAFPQSNGNRFRNGNGGIMGKPSGNGPFPHHTDSSLAPFHGVDTTRGGMGVVPDMAPSKDLSKTDGMHAYKPADKTVYPGDTYPALPHQQFGYPSNGHPDANSQQTPIGSSLPSLHQIPLGIPTDTDRQPTTHYIPGKDFSGKSSLGVQTADRVPVNYPAVDQQTPWGHRLNGAGNGQLPSQQPIQPPIQQFPYIAPDTAHTPSVSVPKTGYASPFSGRPPQSSTDSGHTSSLYGSSMPSYGNSGFTMGVPISQSFGNGRKVNSGSGEDNQRYAGNIPLYSGQNAGRDDIGATPLFSQSRPLTNGGTIASKVMAGHNGQLLSSAVVGGVEAGQAQSQGILHGNGFRTHVISRPGGPVDTPIQPSNSHNVGPWLSSGQAQAQGYNRAFSLGDRGHTNGNSRINGYPKESAQRPLQTAQNSEQTISGSQNPNGYQQPQPASTHLRTYPVKKGTVARWPSSSQTRGIPLTSQRQPHYISSTGTLRRALKTRNRYSSPPTFMNQCSYTSCSNGYRLVKTVKICKLAQPCQR